MFFQFQVVAGFPMYFVEEVHLYLSFSVYVYK